MKTVKQLGPWSGLSSHSYDGLAVCLWQLNRASSNFDFYVKFGLEGQSLNEIIGISTKVCQCQLPPQTTENSIIISCTSGPNVVILAWTGNDLWCRQARGWCTNTHIGTHMDAHTDGQTQATTILEGHNWPRVKIIVQVTRKQGRSNLCVCVFCGIHGNSKFHEVIN